MPVKDSSTLKVGDIITEKKLQEVFHMLPDQVIPFGEYVGIGMLALIKGNGQEKLTDLPIIPIFYNPSDKIKNDGIIETVTENNKKLESKMNLSIKPNLNPILVEGEVVQDATTGRYFVGDGKTPLVELKPRDDIMIQKYCESAKIARVICGYPGIGKSWLNKNSDLKVLDSDSSKFSWIYDEFGNKTEKRNLNFVEDYIRHIKENLFFADIICVSTHLNIREALMKEHIDFVTVYPDINEKKAFLKRYKERGSSESFIEDQAANWEARIGNIENEPHGSKLIYLKANQNLADILLEIM